MNRVYSVYFFCVTLSALYGIEWNPSYLTTLLLTNVYYTAGEYLFHRITFHSPVRFPALSLAHSKHHDQPTNEKRLFIPIAVTLMNDVFFIAVNAYLKTNILHFISASHLSYLAFEVSHYASHLPLSYVPLPSRLIAFHHHHHANDQMNYGFTTPAWDLLFGTSSHFSIKHYPLCYVPLSIVSFLHRRTILLLLSLIGFYWIIVK